MKKIITLIILLAVTLLAGCQNKSESQSIESQISGLWYANDTDSHLHLDTNGIFWARHIPLWNGEDYVGLEGTWILSKDGEIGFSTDSSTNYWHYAFDGDTLTIDDCKLTRSEHPNTSGNENDTSDNIDDNFLYSENETADFEDAFDSPKNSFEFLKQMATAHSINTEHYSRYGNSHIITDTDQIEYNKYSAQESGESESIIYEDDNYKVSRLSDYIYAVNKTSNTEMCYTISDSFHEYLSSEPKTSFYSGENLYILYEDRLNSFRNDIQRANTSYSDDHTYQFNGTTYEQFGDFTNILLITPINIEAFDEAVFSEDKSYMCLIQHVYTGFTRASSGTEFDVVNTTTLSIESISIDDMFDDDNLFNPIVTNDGTVIFANANIDLTTYCKFLDEDTYYTLDGEFNPIYVDNENNELFVETEVGIKKITADSNELIFKYLGFDSSAVAYYGVLNGQNSSIIRITGGKNKVYKELNLLEY